MKAEYLNPFLKSTVETFKIMVDIPVALGRIYLLKEPNDTDIASVIEFSGDVIGKVAILYTKDVALKISSKFLGEKMTDLNGDVADCIREIANIIAGSAKKYMQSLRLTISLPTVVRGPVNIAEKRKDIPVICIPFNSEVGSFIMETKMTSRSLF
jgi:chemotaxis protein CheX